jgi:prepilin-type N-terminal cleavage/methylation domain-containing protein
MRTHKTIGTGPDAGFTLLEMVVAVAIFTVVTGAIIGLLKVGRSNRFTTSQRVESIQNVRNALNQIGRECLDAGVEYYPNGAQLPDDTLSTLGFFATDSDSTVDYLVPIMARNNIDTNGLSGVTTDRVSFVYGDDNFTYRFNGPDSQPNTNDDVVTSYIPFDQRTSGTDFRIYNTGGTSFANTQFTVGQPYLLAETGTSPKQAIAVCTAVPTANTTTVTFGSDTLNINLPTTTGVPKTLTIAAGNPPTTPPTLVRATPLVVVSYYVDSGGTLYRRLYGNYTSTNNATAGTGVTVGSTQYLDSPLAFGVEDFQIQYLLKDGVVTSTPTTTQCVNIRQVQITVTVRSPEKDMKTNQYLKTTLTATFNARNLAYSGR